jgi:hypothetical protein
MRPEVLVPLILFVVVLLGVALTVSGDVLARSDRLSLKVTAARQAAVAAGSVGGAGVPGRGAAPGAGAPPTRGAEG